MAKETTKIQILSLVILFVVSIVLSLVLGTSITRNIIGIVEQLSSSATKVHQQSGKVSEASKSISHSTSEQASSLQETAASLEEISSMINRASDGAALAADRSLQSTEKAEQGKVATTEMLTSMNEISQSNEAILTQINESNREMTNIVKVIQDIGNRTKVINEIVFQTKLLSFNASVEAARAGEHGKGFAVVAEEVGNLAQMSGNAAEEITDMLDASIAKVEGIVRKTQTKVESLVQNGKEKVDSGVTVAKRCSDFLNEIVENVSSVSGLSQDISQASKEQAQGVSEINKAMSQLDSVTQQNTATSQETSTVSSELSYQADILKELVGELVVAIEGRNSQRAERYLNDLRHGHQQVRALKAV